MVPYVVRKGDYMRKLAARFGFDAEEVWNDPRNADLRAQRRSMDVLISGDLLYVPESKDVVGLPISKETSQSYTAKIPTVFVRQRLVMDGKPLAGEPFHIEGGALSLEGTSDGDGWVSVEVPTVVQALTLTLPNRRVTLHLQVGGMDPENTHTGRAMRLRHLGFLSAGHPEPLTPSALQDALAAFQRHYGLEETGVIDAQTEKMLIDAHGS